MKLIICPACEGKKVVSKTSNGEPCYYSDRITVMRMPCVACNGSGLVPEDKVKEFNNDNGN